MIIVDPERTEKAKKLRKQAGYAILSALVVMTLGCMITFCGIGGTLFILGVITILSSLIALGVQLVKEN